ncbi:MAG: nucleotidyltransferase domain-containing protein [archaeon]
MEPIVKLTREVGTSAGVLLPRSWLNKEVVVTLKDLSDEDIAKGILGILLEKGLLSDVKGIYLVGSYARGDYSASSDVDVLVVTGKTNKLIELRGYEIVLVSEENLSKNLPSDLYKLLAVREARVIVNQELIEKYRNVVPRLNVKKLKDEMRSVLKINNGAVESCKERVPDAIVYSLVLRLRELYSVRCLIKGILPNKNKFLREVGEKAYGAYLRVKRNGREINDLSVEEASKLLGKLEKWLKE